MKQALGDVIVLDFTQLLQGPYATQMLGDLGADIIKIEKPGTGDLYRSLTFFNEWLPGGESVCFMPWNRNKRSLAINLKAPEAKEVIYRLVERADVVVENFRPGVMDRLGFGYEDLRSINPRIIYCSSTGWGNDGPYADRPGQDILVQGLSGAMMQSGRADDGPVPLGTALSDQLGALHIVYGVLAALYHRERTGEGQRIDVNLLSSVLAFQTQDFFTVQNLGRSFDRPRSGIAHPGNGAPFGVYETSDGYITIAMNPWDKVVEALGDPSIAEFGDPQVLFDRRDEIWERMQEIIRRKTTREWLDIMLAIDLWVAEVKSQAEVEDDPQVKHLQAFTEIEHPRAGRVKVTGIPIRLSRTPGAIRRPAPLVGEHGREVLSEHGFSEDEIDVLLQRGVLSIDEVSEHSTENP